MALTKFDYACNANLLLIRLLKDEESESLSNSIISE